MTFTTAQRAASIAETRKSFADSPHKPRVVMKSIEQDLADNQVEITALRADVNALTAQVDTLSRMVAGLAQDISEFRSFTKGAPQAGGGVIWWEWVRQHVDACLEARLEDYSESVGAALGEKVRDVLEEVGRAMDARKSEIELLRRELTVLRGEVGVEHELRELRSSIAKAQRAVPQVPTIVAGLRSEAQSAKDESDRKIAGLRKAVRDVQHALATARVEQGVAASALKRGLGQELEVEWEATSRSARMVVRPSIHPDAEKTLREFAAKVIDGSVIQH